MLDLDKVINEALELNEASWNTEEQLEDAKFAKELVDYFAELASNMGFVETNRVLLKDGTAKPVCCDMELNSNSNYEHKLHYETSDYIKYTVSQEGKIINQITFQTITDKEHIKQAMDQIASHVEGRE